MIDLDKALGRSSSVVEGDVPESVEELDGDWASFGDFELVGNGSVTNERCGSFAGVFYGCDRVSKHNMKRLDGKDCLHKVHIAKPVLHSCYRPSCPTCFRYSWLPRSARSITARLKEASKRFGLVEHLMISLPVRDYDMDLEAMRLKVIRLLKSLGVHGSALVFHGFRYANPIEAKRKDVVVGWRWSVHFHVIGYIRGGYSRCRSCPTKWNCRSSCDGFDSKAWALYLKSGFKVKVFSKRESIYWTAYYILSHATVKKDSIRFHPFTYFGCISYHKMAVVEDLRKASCPLCGLPLVKLRYSGSKLHFLFLRHVKNIFVDLKESADWALLAKEVVWKRC